MDHWFRRERPVLKIYHSTFSLSLFHLKTETDPFTEMLCFVKPEWMEMFDTSVTSI